MPMPPNANAIFQELNTIVVATFAAALANTEWAPEADSLIYELDVPETKLNFDFALDTFGLQKMKKNLTKKGVIQKQISLLMEEWEDNISVAERDLSTSQGGTVKMQAEMRGKSIPRWKDQQVVTLLGPGGDAFTRPSFDEVPYFSKQHSMKLGGDNSLANVANLDDAGGGDYWFMFDDSLIKPVWLNWKTRPRRRDDARQLGEATRRRELLERHRRCQCFAPLLLPPRRHRLERTERVSSAQRLLLPGAGASSAASAPRPASCCIEPRRVRNAPMRDLLALLVLVMSTTQVACKKAETKEPTEETKAEVTAPATDPGEEAQLAMLELVQECFEGGPPPVGLLVNVKLNNANEIESVTIEPPADEPTTACVIAKVKASDLKAMSQVEATSQ